MDYKKIQEACKKMSGFLNSGDHFEYLNEYASQLKKNGAAEKDIIVHHVVVHGFMDWMRIVGCHFPCLYPISGEKEFERCLYNRFFRRLIGMPAFEDLSKQEKEELQERGWKEYLED